MNTDTAIFNEGGDVNLLHEAAQPLLGFVRMAMELSGEKRLHFDLDFEDDGMPEQQD
jgi:hypothetical protein